MQKLTVSQFKAEVKVKRFKAIPSYIVRNISHSVESDLL